MATRWYVPHLVVLLAVLVSGVSVLPPLPVVEASQSSSEDKAPSVDKARREAAYRANNIGVALLEQFKYRDGAEAFRRALAQDEKLGIAQLNLAIALYNEPKVAEAREAALRAEKMLSDSPHVQYLLGLIARSQSRDDEALERFGRVLAVDPTDIGSNVNVGQIHAQQRKYADAAKAFRAAVDAEPYNLTATYNLGTALVRLGQRDEGQRLLARFQELRQSGAGTTIGPNYLEQGRYAEAVISTGREPDLVDESVPEVRFVDASGLLSRTDEPSCVALFDVDDDGVLELFIGSGERRQFLRPGNSQFQDATKGPRIPGDEPKSDCVGVVSGDYDNDGRADLFVLRRAASSLYRNRGDGSFEDVTTAARVVTSEVEGACAAFVDLDHDGDLDIFVGGKPESRDPSDTSGAPGPRTASGASNCVVLRNNGDGTFENITAATGLSQGGAPVVAVVPTDFDNRRDVDLVLVYSGAPVGLFRNLRDGTFRNVADEVGLGPLDGRCIAACDINKDGYVDLFIGSRTAAAFALSDGRGRFSNVAGPVGASDLIAAQFLDYDNDGLVDLLGAAPGGLRIWRNIGDGWRETTDTAFSKSLAAPATDESAREFVGLVTGDCDRDGDLDIVATTRGGGVVYARNDGGNRNRSLLVDLSGKVSNRSGVGAKVELRSGSLWQKLESYAAFPAPAPTDLLFGLGDRTEADALRILWPAGILQAELDVGSADATAGTSARFPVTELDRKPSSCPFLYAWNGERFEFVTDFMGGGELGAWLAPGVRSQPDPDEFVRITDQQLSKRDGRYELRVTNELEEVLYVDRLRLLAVDHPADVEIYPREGLRSPARTGLSLVGVSHLRPPVAARDGRGRDLLARVAHLDRAYADTFAVHAIRGYAEEHSLELDLGDLDPNRTILLLTGWTDYAFSSDNVAASQAGLSLSPPRLQVKDEKGTWRTVDEDIGFPVGRPQTIVVDLNGRVPVTTRELRIVTNMRVYWDQVAVGTTVEASGFAVESMEAGEAELRWRGYSEIETPDGREPFGYDYDTVSELASWKLFPGRYTREGDVRALLRNVDDVFVVSRTGDEIVLSFDGRALAPLRSGWRRTFLFHADGFSKEMDINSSSPDTVMPYPYHAMTSYPYPTSAGPPWTGEQQALMERFTTRTVVPKMPRSESFLAHEWVRNIVQSKGAR